MAEISGDDWTLEVFHGYYDVRFSYSALWPGLGQPRYLVTLRLDARRGLLLLEALADAPRGYPGFTVQRDGGLTAERIEVSEKEANQIAGGVHPAEILFGDGWPYGYRLIAVPDQLGGMH